jgi:hypothetical protein
VSVCEGVDATSEMKPRLAVPHRQHHHMGHVFWSTEPFPPSLEDLRATAVAGSRLREILASCWELPVCCF